MPAQLQLDSEAATLVEMVVLCLTGAGENVDLPFYHPGQFQKKKPTTMRPGVNGDQPLVIREPKTPIVLPSITRTLTDFQMFSAEQKISLVRINI